MNVRRSSVLVILLVGALSIGFLVGCGKQGQFGQPIPSNVTAVKLTDILEKPAGYKDKEVLLDLNYGSYCCADDFSCKEGYEGVEVVPAGFPSVKAKPGQPVRVFGVVRVGERQHAHEEEKNEGEGKTEKHHELYIEAKGVQLK